MAILSTLRPPSEDIASPGGVAWKPVPVAEMGQLPYVAVGRLELYDQGGLFGAGTAWLAGAATAVTAAHCFAPPMGGGVTAVRLVLPGLSQPVPVLDARIHPNFRGQGLVVDPWDIAVVRLPPLSRPRLALGDPGPPPPFAAEVPGFPNGQAAMVRHAAQALRVRPDVLIHKVDTATGHSGAPVIRVGAPASAVGVHVGGFASNPASNQFPSSNTALPLAAPLVAFIQTHLNVWG